MTKETPNHAYEQPEKGDENWHEPLNNNFDRLDADVILKGAHGDRPGSPPEGTWFLATDRNQFSYYDGSSWKVIGGVGTPDEPVPQAHYGELSAEVASVRGARVQTWLSQDSVDIEGEGTEEATVSFSLNDLFTTYLRKSKKRAWLDVRISAIGGDGQPLYARWRLFVMRTDARQHYVDTFERTEQGPRPFDFTVNDDGTVVVTLRAKGPIEEIDVEVPRGYNPREFST
ncbi:hypothetical protein [Haloarchaeobius sp. DYHT-AS-18]|uniref:hypothetical protein n=1 Tax=Haloarchaeobius sp. DYHT-AS-18 TaxID=3446117 RepID=UPI003EC0E325